MTVALAMHQPRPPKHRLPLPATSAPFLFSKNRAARCRPSAFYRISILIILSVTFITICLFLPSHLSPIVPPLPIFSFSSARRLSRRALRFYQRQLHLRPLVSRALTAAVIFFVADFSAQVLNSSPAKSSCSTFSFQRLVRYTAYGLFVMGPFLYVWYSIMTHYGPPDDLSGSLLKCLFEQFTLEPICIAMYIVYDAIICRRGVRVVTNTLSQKFLPLWFKNAVFWLPANFANYYIGTPDLRVIFANLCSLFWNIYFSAKVNSIPINPFTDDVFLNHDRQPISYSKLSHPRSSVPAASRPLQPITLDV